MGLVILAVNGSPHEAGNTGRAVARALEICRAEGCDVMSIWLAGLAIAPCRGCFACREGDCAQSDGMDEVCAAMRACDGMLLASPVYMGMVSGQMKVMMDRTVRLRTGGRFELSGKVGAGIACGGFRNGGQELTLQCMHTFFLQQDMMVVADGPPYSHSGAAVAGPTEGDRTGLVTVENVVRRLLRALGS